MLALLLCLTADPVLTAPLNVRGRVADEAGRPVAGAIVRLATDRVSVGVVAETTTDADGRYAFEDAALPVEAGDDPADDSGRFEVFAFADGYALAWDQPYWYDPQLDRPRQFVGGVRQAYAGNETAEIDLTLRPPRPIRGRVVDDAGQPVEGFVVDVRDADRQLDPKEAGRFGGDDGSLEALNERDIVPRELKTARTDADGRFELTCLPAGVRATLWLSHAEFPGRRFAYVTAEGEDFETESGWRTRFGFLDVAVPRPSWETFRLVAADTGEPVAGSLTSTSSEAGSRSAVTDADGRVRLPIYAGENDFFAAPPHGSTLLRAEETVVLDPELGVGGPVTVRMARAATLEVMAVGAASGEPVEGLWLWREVVDAPVTGYYRQAMVHDLRTFEAATRISHVNRRATGEDGVVRHEFVPGFYRVGLADSEHDSAASRSVEPRQLTLRSGETARVRFEVRGR